jgi:hypothetical protein
LSRFRRLLLAAILVLAALAWGQAAREERGDFTIYCAALAALETGRSPYDLAALRRHGSPSNLPMTNPALMLPALAPICAGGTHVIVWIALIVLTASAAGVLLQPADWPLLAAVVAGGFAAAPWILQTGNIAAVEMFLAGAAIAALARGRLALFSGAIGAAAFLKLMPAALVILVVPVAGIRRAVKCALAAAVVFAALHAVYALAMPRHFADYWAMLLGPFLPFFGAEAVHGAETHPSLLSLLMTAAYSLTGRSWPGVPLFAAAAAAIGIDLLRLGRRVPTGHLLPLAALAVLLVMPRLKPYAFGLGVVPLYLGAVDLTASRQVLVLLVSCVVPLATWSTWHPEGGGFAYGQLYGLIGAYALVRAFMPTDILKSGVQHES